MEATCKANSTKSDELIRRAQELADALNNKVIRLKNLLEKIERPEPTGGDDCKPEGQGAVGFLENMAVELTRISKADTSIGELIERLNAIF